MGAFSDAIERVELREALAEVSVEARELRGRLQHATAVARETETAAAAAEVRAAAEASVAAEVRAARLFFGPLAATRGR